MRNPHVPWIVLVFVALVAGGCKKGKPPEQAQLPSPATNISVEKTQSTERVVQKAPKAAGTLLQVKWPIGNRYIYRLDMDQHTTNQVAGANEPVTEDTSLGVTYALTVVEETTEGGRELEIEFLANDLEIKMGGKVAIAFAAARGRSNDADHPVPPPFQKMIGSKTLIRMNAQGTVEKVLGWAGWLKSVAGDATGPAGQMVAQQFSEAFFRQTADFGLSLPTRTVRPGEAWPFQLEIPAGDLGRIRLDTKITLAEWREHELQKLALLTSTGTLTNIQSEARPSPGPRLENGKVLGTSLFDPALGALTESNVDQSMRIISASQPLDTGTTPASGTVTDISQKVTIKLVEVIRGAGAERPKPTEANSKPQP